MAKLTRRRRRRRIPRRKDQPEAASHAQAPRISTAKQAVDAALKAGRRGDLAQSPQTKAQEAEADRFADHVTSRGADAAPMSTTNTSPNSIQTKPDPTASANGSLPKSQGQGAPLPQDQKVRFSRPLGDSLDNVRIDTTGEGARVANALGARAVTIGKRISFASTEYAPDTAKGSMLLAHELAHTVQQKRSGTQTIQRKPSQGSKHGHPGTEGGLLHDSARARMNIFIKKGDTLNAIAAKLLPIWLASEASLTSSQKAAIPNEVRSVEGLAKALLVHHQSYLTPPEMTAWQDGLRLPLPALRDPADDRLVVNLPLAGSWLQGWNSAWAPALKKSAGGTVNASGEGSAALTSAFLSNPKSALVLAQEKLGSVDTESARTAIGIMNALVDHQVGILSAAPEGKQIFTLISAAIDVHKSSLDPKDVARAEKMLSSARVVDKETARATVDAYLAANTSNCMAACYIGLEALLGGDKRKAIEEAVAQKDAANPSVDLNQVITMMEMMEAAGSAGAPFVMEQNHSTLEWDNHPDSVIETILNQNQSTRGYYFFGVSVVTGYHTVTMVLSNRNPEAPILLILDQNGNFNDTNFYGRLSEFFESYAQRAREADPNYKTLISKLWPIYPNPATLLKLD